MSMDREQDVSRAMCDLALHASGGKVSALFNRFEDIPGRDTVQRTFRDADINWGNLVAHDVDRVLSGLHPEYFMSHQEWAELYRSRRGIPDPTPPAEIHRPGGLEPEDLRASQQQIASESAEHGAAIEWLETGYACPREQQYFYGTTEWKRRAKATRFVLGYRCSRCGAKDKELHVHHMTPIISAYHYNFDLNFAPWKLKVLCQNCHQEYHEQAIRSYEGYCFILASSDQHDEYIEQLANLSKLQHDRGLCKFCANHIAERYPNVG